MGCLALGYIVTITDGYGDGMYGSQYGSCTVDGSYSIESIAMFWPQLIHRIQFGSEEVNPFCIIAIL